MIVGVHSEKQLQLPDMMHFNLSDQQRGAFYSVQIAHLDSDKCTFFPDPDNPSIIAESENAERHRAQMSRLLARQSRRRILQEAFSTKLFDTLIIGVTRTDPLALISRLSPFLRGSARLVIYAPFRELVTPAYQELRSRPNHWLDVGLQGSWLRPFQAAPGRIHPLNNCNGGTGSVLYATKAL